MPDLNQLVWAARREARAWTHPALAKLLGCSLRTVQRHPDSGGVSQEHHYHLLIQAVHPTNPALAAQLAAARNTSLEALGLARPAPAAPPPDPTRSEHWDSVVCAAANVLQLPPSAVAPAVAAAFARAQALGVTVAGLVREAAAGTAKPSSRARGS